MSACITCLGLGEPLFVIRIPRRVTSQNNGGSNKRAGMFAYKRERDAWIRDLHVMGLGRPMPRDGQQRVVRITREYSGRCQQMDYGNLVGGLKPVIDAMQREIGGKARSIKGAGLIVDDSSKHFLGIYEQRRTERDAVMFEVWDLPDK